MHLIKGGSQQSHGRGDGGSGNGGNENDETEGPGAGESEEESESGVPRQHGRHEQLNGDDILDWLADWGGQTIQYGGSELTLQEVAIIATTLPAVTRAVQENAEIAKKAANEWGESKQDDDEKPKGEHNGRTDAVRHALWSALNARDAGERNARRFAKAHEADSDQPDVERQMDHHNNEVGIQIGLANPNASDAELLDLVDQAYEKGKLMTEPNPAINPDRRTYPDNRAY